MNWIALLSSLATVALLSAAGKKWELKIRHFLPWSVLMALSVFFIVSLLTASTTLIPTLAIAAGIVATAIVASIGAILFFFFRDPERQVPQRADRIVSPADGTVIYIKQINAGTFPFAVKKGNSIPLDEFTTERLIPQQGIQIGIAMNYLNVHVNRSPIAGTITMLKSVPGLFNSLKHIESLLENERVLMVFESKKLKVGIVQIASRLVRRIVPFVAQGDQVLQGDRVGRITFGSQVDLLIAHREDLRIMVKEGDEVFAGLSTLIELDPNRSV